MYLILFLTMFVCSYLFAGLLGLSLGSRFIPFFRILFMMAGSVLLLPVYLILESPLVFIALVFFLLPQLPIEQSGKVFLYTKRFRA